LGEKGWGEPKIIASGNGDLYEGKPPGPTEKVFFFKKRPGKNPALNF